MDEKPILSIVVPVYNEEDNVRPLFEKIQTVCEAIGDAYEVLFVDDGSKDKTFRRAFRAEQTGTAIGGYPLRKKCRTDSRDGSGF